MVYANWQLAIVHPDLKFCCALGCDIWYSALCYSPLYLDCSYFSVIIKTLKCIQLICYLSGTSLERLDNNRTRVRTLSLPESLLDKVTETPCQFLSCVYGDVIIKGISITVYTMLMCGKQSGWWLSCWTEIVEQVFLVLDKLSQSDFTSHQYLHFLPFAIGSLTLIDRDAKMYAKSLTVNHYQ